MLKKTLAIIALIVLVAGATAAIATYIVQYYFPNLGSIATLQTYLGTTLYPNGTEIKWGPCEPDALYVMEENLTVVNAGSTALTVTLTPHGLLNGWTLTWNGNNTLLQAGANVTAPLELYIPANATYWPTWGFYINGA